MEQSADPFLAGQYEEEYYHQNEDNLLIYDDEGADSDVSEDERNFSVSMVESERPLTQEQKFTRQEQLRMLHLRKHLDQLSDDVSQKEFIVQKTRDELKTCKDRIEELENERDQVYSEIKNSQAVGDVSSANRLRAQHARCLQELEGEQDLCDQIRDVLDQAEYDLALACVEQGKFQLADEDLGLKEDKLLRERTNVALVRNEKEDKFVRDAKKRRKEREREHVRALQEREQRYRHTMSEARKSKEQTKKHISNTLDKIKKREQEEEERYKAQMDRRVKTLLALKGDITSNRENLKAQQARDRSLKKSDDVEEEALKQFVQQRGGNVEEAVLIRKRINNFEDAKLKHVVSQRENQVEIASKLLLEEERLKRRQKLQPYLFDDPLKEKKKRVSPHKKRKLKIFEQAHGDSLDQPIFNKEKYDDPEYTQQSSEDESPRISEDKIVIPDSDSEDETNAMLAKPEFEGMWNVHKPYKVPKDGPDPVLKLPGASKMDQEIMQKKMERQRENIVQKQVVVGREFKGSAFYSKPGVIHFKDFVVGKTYKKKVTLTNVSYTVNFCKLVGITEHLKDFIDILFDPPGQMSAGLTCEMLVTFKPMINEDLNGEVSFLAQTGPFAIPLFCTTKKCDLSVDANVADFSTSVIGETLKRTVTLTNNGALGTKFDFFKVAGLKMRTLTTAETSLGRLTTADTNMRALSPDSDEALPKEEENKTLKSKAADGAGDKEKPLDLPPSTDQPENPDGEVRGQEDGLEIGSTVEPPFSDLEDIANLDGMKVGQLSSVEIGPFSLVKLDIIWQPTIPGKVDTEFVISFADPLSANITITALANAIDVPVWVERQNVDLKICMFDRLFQDTIVVNNRATTALRLKFEVCKELKNYMELLPKTGYIQAQSQFSAQLKFVPRQSLVTDNNPYFDKQTGVLEAPMIITVAGQTRPVPFTVHAVITRSDLEFDKTDIDFGFCTIYESVKTTVKLTNYSILSQQFGFMGLPEYVEVQPNDGFGTLLPLETIELEIIYSPKKAKNYTFELTCKSLINRDFKIKCQGVGVLPPLELSKQVIHFAATAMTDVSTVAVHVINSHTSTNEFTHPVPRIGKGEIAPVCPTSFEFRVPEDSPITISPSVGTVKPGQKMRVEVRFAPNLPVDQVKREAVRVKTRAMEALKEQEYQETLQREKERLEAEAVVAKTGGGALNSSDKERSESSESPKKKTAPPKGKPSPKGKGNRPGAIQEISVKGPGPVTPPSVETISTKSDEFYQATTSLLRQFKGDFATYTIPCNVASGKCGNPGELSYSIYNTLYLNVHCPMVKPQLVAISDNGRTMTDFGDVSICQNVIKSITLQNICDEVISVNCSILDTCGPFLVLNAFRDLKPDESHTMLISFTPGAGRVYQEVLELVCPKSTLRVTLVGRGVDPKVKLSLESNVLDMQTVLTNEYVERTFNIQNTSTLSIDYNIKLDSNSLLRHSKAQRIPDFIKRDISTEKSLVGVQNYNGQSVFDCVPAEGKIPAGETQEITLTFAPDHPSNYYSDVIRLELFNQEEAHRFRVIGQAKARIMFVEGGDELTPEVQSLAVLPVVEEEEDAKPTPIPILLTMTSVSTDEGHTMASRDLFVGCVRTMAVSQKKNGEFSFENTNLINAKGFQLDPPKGMLEAGTKRPITFTWTPPAGHDSSQTVEGSIIMTVKGDVVDTYNILLRARIGTTISED